MNLDRILGQQEIKEKIYSSILNKSFPQSKILVDRDGYGGLNMAIEIAMSLLKNDYSFNGDIYDHPDLHFSFPSFASIKDDENVYSEWLSFLRQNTFGDYQKWSSYIGNTVSQGSIKVSEIEKVQKKSALKAYLGGNKVFIFWGAETMMSQTANKLLKILEEPPANTYFILITSNIQAILPTIISRCQISNLNPINKLDHTNYIKENFPGVNHNLIVNTSRGSVARSLNYLDEESESISHEKNFVDCLRFAFLAKKSRTAILELMKWSEKLSSIPKDQQKDFLSYCSYLIREAMLISYSSKNLGSFSSSTDFKIDKLSLFVHSSNLIEIISMIEDCHYSITRNVNSKIVFTNFAIILTKLINKEEV